MNSEHAASLDTQSNFTAGPSEDSGYDPSLGPSGKTGDSGDSDLNNPSENPSSGNDGSANSGKRHAASPPIGRSVYHRNVEATRDVPVATGLTDAQAIAKRTELVGDFGDSGMVLIKKDGEEADWDNHTYVVDGRAPPARNLTSKQADTVVAQRKAWADTEYSDSKLVSKETTFQCNQRTAFS